jgi:hypothetical protein
MARGEFNAFIFTPEGPVALFLRALLIFFITGYLLKKYTKSQPSLLVMIKASLISLLFYVLMQNAFGYSIAVLFDTVDRNFNFHTLILVNVEYVLDFCIFGAFFMAHYYYQQGKEKAKRLREYEKALAESKIKSLKAQLNPHFLFNNLNILDQLMEENTDEARQFLDDFSEIYRYVLSATERRKIGVKEEVKFAEKYFRLIQKKYDLAYQLDLEGDSEGYLPPLSLQLLIENVIKHNIGTNKDPVNIQVRLTKKNITVINDHKPKINVAKGSGTGLQNLSDQYAILSDHMPIIEVQEKKFKVTIPILQ